MFTREELDGYFRYCLALTHDEPSAFDLLQQGIVKFLESNTGSVRNREAYIIRTIRNQFIDGRRSLKRLESVELNDSMGGDQFGRAMDDIIADRQDVSRLLTQITADERELLFLTAVNGHTVQEVSELLETPRGTLLAKLHRLRKKIKSTLATKSGESEVKV